MDVTISPRPLQGQIKAVASKSVAHRLLILAALAPQPTAVACDTTSKDIEATIGCLEAMGAHIEARPGGYDVSPIGRDPASGRLRPRRAQLLDCGESGSTLRFLLPVVCALGADERLCGHGRLAERPLSPLYGQLVEHGAFLSPEGSFPLHAGGRLRPGRFVLPGDVSSQFVSGLLMAAPIMELPCEVLVSEPVESRPYIALTVSALAAFGVEVQANHDVETPDGMATSYVVKPRATPLRSPGTIAVEGDWSNAAFWLAAGAIGGTGITVSGLDSKSAQGDRAIMGLLASLGAEARLRRESASTSARGLAGRVIDVSATPDLVMPLAAAAAFAGGETSLVGAGRLRLKESDRIETVAAALRALGATVTTGASSIAIEGGRPLAGGVVDAANDHRIAMMAAICGAFAQGPTTIRGAECVAKSYPGFFDDFRALGGQAEASGMASGSSGGPGSGKRGDA